MALYGYPTRAMFIAVRTSQLPSPSLNVMLSISPVDLLAPFVPPPVTDFELKMTLDVRDSAGKWLQAEVHTVLLLLPVDSVAAVGIQYIFGL